MTIILIIIAAVFVLSILSIGWQILDVIVRAFRRDTWRIGR